MIEWCCGAGFWGLGGGRLDFLGGGSGGVVLSGFARFFGYLGGYGRLEGLDGVSALAPLHGLAGGLGEWLRLLVSFFAVLLF